MTIKLSVIGPNLSRTFATWTAILLFMSALLWMPACRHINNERLRSAMDSVGVSPQATLDMLQEIRRDSLDEKDRHIYDFLQIKANDKLYILHTSDSLILSVIDYTKDNMKELYPEALYYGGRVYSDLGDSPTAYRYFTEALSYLPPDTKQQVLRGNALSQTGRLLMKMRMRRQAIPYLRETMLTNNGTASELDRAYDNFHLGLAYDRTQQYDSAEYLFKKALVIAKNLPMSHQADIRVAMADMEYNRGNYKSALDYIRNMPAYTDTIGRNIALVCASKIYLANNILDTAYMYASALAKSPYESGHKVGFNIMLNPELRKFVPTDSLDDYYSEYNETLEKLFNENESVQLAIQNSSYNYHTHVEQKLKAEASSNRKQMWIYFLSAAIAYFVIIVMLVLYRNRITLIELHKTLDTVNRLKILIYSQERSKGVDSISPEDLLTPPSDNDITNLRSQIKKEILKAFQNAEEKEFINKDLLQSDILADFRNKIENGQSIPENSKMWTMLKEAVEKSSPGFVVRVSLLLGRSARQDEQHIVLLAKCGFTPTEMTILLGKTKGTLSNRRATLCRLMFDEKLGAAAVDKLIRLL